MSRRAVQHMQLTEEQQQRNDSAASEVNLATIGYRMTPEQARHWATAFKEDAETWARRWAEALQARADAHRLPWPWPTWKVRLAIRKHFEEGA